MAATSRLLATSDEIRLSISEVRATVPSFPNSSSDGPEGLSCDNWMISFGKTMTRATPLAALTRSCSMVINGRLPTFTLRTSFVAHLIALRKEDGGFGPIAVEHAERACL